MWIVLITACVCFWDTLSVWLYVDINQTVGIVVACITAAAHIVWFLFWAIVVQASCEHRDKISFWDSLSNMILSLVSTGTFAAWMAYVITYSLLTCKAVVVIIAALSILMAGKALSSAYIHFVRYPRVDEDTEEHKE